MTAEPGRGRRLDRLCYAVATVGLAGAAVTACLGWWNERGLSGWPLLIHTGAGPVLLIGLGACAVRFAERYSPAALRRGAVGLSQNGPVEGGASHRALVRPFEKLLFWAAMVFGSTSGLSILAAMLPIFGYADQLALYDAHGTSGWCLAAVALVHGALSLSRRDRG